MGATLRLARCLTQWAVGPTGGEPRRGKWCCCSNRSRGWRRRKPTAVAAVVGAAGWVCRLGALSPTPPILRSAWGLLGGRGGVGLGARRGLPRAWPNAPGGKAVVAPTGLLARSLLSAPHAGPRQGVDPDEFPKLSRTSFPSSPAGGAEPQVVGIPSRRRLKGRGPTRLIGLAPAGRMWGTTASNAPPSSRLAVRYVTSPQTQPASVGNNVNSALERGPDATPRQV